MLRHSYKKRENKFSKYNFEQDLGQILEKWPNSQDWRNFIKFIWVLQCYVLDLDKAVLCGKIESGMYQS